ncbi:MAG: hypothetical protein GF330_09485 [Candidatus Eisenbacteria bacterium]|nr:hypothetical protein [Candidatus Eisenbacteria bacterium]
MQYRSIIEGLMDDPGYFKITINSYDFTPPTGSIDFDIEVMEPVPDLNGLVARACLTEDELYYNVPGADDWHHDVNRGMIADVPITVSQLGDVQNVSTTFAVDPSYVQEELKMNVFIQYDGTESEAYGTKWALASAVTRENPDYSLRYFALGDRAQVAPAGNFAFDFFHVYNFGNLSDSYTVSVDIESPEGWTAVLCDDGVCYGPTYQQTLAPQESFFLKVEGEATGTGYAKMTVTMSQASNPGMERTLTYVFMTDDLEVLLVDDDGADAYEDYFIDVLDHHGYAYGVWDRNSAVLSADLMSNFPVLVWNLGWSFPTLDADDRDALGTYLDAGGKLFITGQDLGWEMYDIGGDARLWYNEYLHALFINDDTNNFTLFGVAGDEISDGLDLVIEGGDGADNQDYPSDIDPADGSASIIWSYDDFRNGALKADTGIYRVVYLAFGFEAIDNAADRRAVLHRSIQWLLTGQSDVTDGAPALRPFLSSLPNPATQSAALRFTLPQAGQASLRLYGPDGRLVRTLAQGAMDAGTHTLEWNRTDAQGERLPAGVYYAKLRGEQVDLTRKLVFVR